MDGNGQTLVNERWWTEGAGWMESGRWTLDIIVMDGQWLQQPTMDNNYNGWGRIATATVVDGQRLQRQQPYRTIHVHEFYSDGVQKKRFFFFFYFVFKKKILLFTFSTDLTACSFDHLCRKPTKMKIKKWSLKKWRKPSVYWSGVPLANLHEELEQQRN